MKRTITISEEFGVWKVATSAGHEASGGTPAIALTNLLVAAGLDVEGEMIEPVAQGAGNRVGEMFSLAIPKQERHDGPVSA